MACATKGFDCVVLERSDEKVAAIKSRLLVQIKDGGECDCFSAQPITLDTKAFPNFLWPYQCRFY